jgi:hypothetical protein
MKRKYLYQFLFVSILTVGFFGLAQKTHAATLSVSPSSSSTSVGQTFTLNILLDTQGQAIDGVDVYSLNYSPSLLQVQDSDAATAGTQISPGSLMTITSANSVNASTGKINFSQITSGGTTYNGSGVLASVTFKALAVGTASVTLNYTPGATNDSNVAGGGTDKLTGVTNAAVAIGSSGDAPPPPPVEPPPPPPAVLPPPTPTPTPTPTVEVTADMYPSGTFFKYPNNATVYQLIDGIAHPITDWTVYQNNVPPTRPILTIPTTVTFEIGSVLGLRRGTLIRAANNPTVYLTIETSKRPFSSETEFLSNGYKFDQVYTINDETLVNVIPTITDDFFRPVGTLFKYANNNTVYFLNSFRIKRPFTTFNMFRLWIDNPKNVITIPDSESYPDGAIVTLPNGILVKGSAATVYLVDQNKLRAFTNVELFNAMGFKFDQIVTVDDADLALHETGEPVQ